MSALNSQETLVLIGAAMAAGCRPCLDVALGRCLELGIDPREVARAREIGCMAANRARSDMDEHSRASFGEFVPGVNENTSATPCSCSSSPACTGS
ncbi:MAG: hypothetical protein HY795_17425 [Desulfovibrio sp.]|nr:hypothetical protein [Desulfovibrio sp.]MBI4958819.1 hypothetical protein [Desulfovibrio sp.]